MLKSLLLLSAFCGAFTLLYAAIPRSWHDRRRQKPSWIDKAVVPVIWIGFPFFFIVFALLMNIAIAGVRRFPESRAWLRVLFFAQSMK